MGKGPTSARRDLRPHVAFVACLAATTLPAFLAGAGPATSFLLAGIGLAVSLLVFASMRAESRARDRIALVAEDLRASQDELKEREQRFREMAAAVDDFFWILDAKTRRLLYVNPAFERVWGTPAGPLREPRAWSDAVHPDDRERVTPADVCAPGGPYDETYRIVRPDGQVRWIRDRCFPIVDAGGELVRVAGVAQDITKVKEADATLAQTEERLRQAQKMEAVGRLAGGVAHDFNNIITVIGGYADLALSDMPEDSPARDPVQTIAEAALKATALTKQLLAFGRRQVLNPAVIDLNSVISELTKMLRRTIGANVELDLALAMDLGNARVDPSQFEQIVMNLVVNARDAMPRGGRLTIETANAELDAAYAAKRGGVAPGPYVALSVTDTGAGIDDVTLGHIFEPFFTTKERGRGTGLGLATVFGIVQQSGGHIEVASRVGRGSTFKVYLPRVEGPAQPTSQAADPAEAPGGTETVLLVEDDAAMRELVRQILERAGYSVLAASSGDDLPTVLGAHQGELELLISDIVMPGLSGPEVSAQVAAVGWSPRVLFMSGYSDAAVVRHGMIAEGAPYLAKPFTAGALLTKVREVLDAPRG